MSADDQVLQNRIYAQALDIYEPEVVMAACDEWAQTKQFWPELASLMALCSEHKQLIDYTRMPKLAAPPVHPVSEPPLTDDERLATWRANDKLAEQMQGTGGFAGALVSIFHNMRSKREDDYPDLAARYYAEQGEAK